MIALADQTLAIGRAIFNQATEWPRRLGNRRAAHSPEARNERLSPKRFSEIGCADLAGAPAPED